MIVDHLSKLLSWNIVLASGSPRRLQIFQQNMGLTNTRVIASTFDESSLDKSQFAHPSLFVVENARQKALQVASSLKQQESTSSAKIDLLVSADTIVSFGDEILEKPKNVEDARRMLKKLSGNQHKVYTGVCFMIAPNGNDSEEERLITFVEETTVMFDELGDSVIEAYIETGEPFDKAGSYGIQEKGGMFVKGISGCYFNVMGFPMQRFSKELAKVL